MKQRTVSGIVFTWDDSTKMWRGYGDRIIVARRKPYHTFYARLDSEPFNDDPRFRSEEAAMASAVIALALKELRRPSPELPAAPDTPPLN
jgi:hypothetical protein